MKKTGGGGKPQDYDPADGQYVDENKEAQLRYEIDNLKKRYYGDARGTFEPRFPIKGLHDDEYGRLYVAHCIKPYGRVFDSRKVSHYLLAPREKGDKSKFFASFGYTIEDCALLHAEILNGADFTEPIYNDITDYGLSLSVPTTIWNRARTRRIYFLSVWYYSEIPTPTMRFVTVIPERRSK